MRDQIEAVLAAIRPGLQRDGGDVELVDVSDDGVVKVRTRGSCCCPVSMGLLQSWIEGALRERVPAVLRVLTIR